MLLSLATNRAILIHRTLYWWAFYGRPHFGVVRRNLCYHASCNCVRSITSRPNLAWRSTFNHWIQSSKDTRKDLEFSIKPWAASAMRTQHRHRCFLWWLFNNFTLYLVSDHPRPRPRSFLPRVRGDPWSNSALVPWIRHGRATRAFFKAVRKVR